VILTIDGAERNHNGGMLAFGPDGYLYIGTGDGGGAGDAHGPIGNGQALNTLLGKILRIDVNADTYRVPDDNPLVGVADALPEIWSFGWRNPWRFSFDRVTGDLYLGDVGQGQYEEVDFQPASSRGGENYGWRIMEGAHCYNSNSDSCNTADLILPIAEYDHDLGCSITGGYVYRGEEFPWLDGQYIFADYCTGIVWVTARDANGEWNTRRVTTFDDTISSFGEDEAGELYVVGHNSGTIYKLTSQP
jgi:glucose/arabinose dehydrogenase